MWRSESSGGCPISSSRLRCRKSRRSLLAFCRVVLAAAILLPIAWRRGALRSLTKHKAAIVAFGLVEFAIPFSLISLGERWISSSVTGILIAMVPLSIALIQRFFGIREAFGPWRMAGLAIGFIGVAALLGTGPISGAGVGGRGLHADIHDLLCRGTADHPAPFTGSRFDRPACSKLRRWRASFY